MPQKRLLYLTANRLSAYSLTRNSLELDHEFAADDAGIAAFSTYVTGSHALYYLVADLVEEDFHQDVIPYLRGSDRRQVLARKIAQRYRDTSLTLTLSLGFEQGERRDEKVLFASFSNTQQFQHWLGALDKHENRLVGVYSTALLAPAVAKRVGVRVPRCLLVSVQQTGLRQSFVDDGKIRFSRVGRLDAQDTQSVAAICASESARLREYLGTMRMMPVGAPLECIILAPGRYHAALSQACRSSDLLRFQVVDADKQCGTAGLDRYPEVIPCESLFLHSVANATPAEQFAQESPRHHYRLWQVRGAVLTAGSAVFALCLLLTGMKLIDTYNLHQLTGADQAQFNSINAEYRRITATFPSAPTSTENLKTTMKRYRDLQTLNASPEYLFIEVSNALADFPQLEIDRIVWRIGKSVSEPGSKNAPPKSPATAPASGVAPAADANYQLAEISARVVSQRRSDLRSITTLVDQFVGTLKKIPRLEVMSVRLPFSVTSENSLKGDIGAEQAAQDNPTFSVIVGRRLGS